MVEEDCSGVPRSLAQADHRALYERLVDAHAASLWRMAYRLTGDHDDAEDLTQEAFYEAWRSIGSLREARAGRSWLFTILTHRASRRLRTARRTPPAERPVDEGYDAAPRRRMDLTRLQDRETVQRALDAVDPARRQTFLLVIQGGFTCREAGEMLDVPLGTVLSRLHRARAELRRELLGQHEGGESAKDADRGSA